jgi:subtilisin family serine protease
LTAPEGIVLRSAVLALAVVATLASVASPGLSPSVEAWLASASDRDRVAVWVFLVDKGPLDDAFLDARIRDVASTFSPKAVARRRAARPDRPFDESDLPLYRPYIERLTRVGVRFRAFSRWLNAVSVEATPGQIRIMQHLAFVRSIRRVSGRAGGPGTETRSAADKGGARLDLYGPSHRQLEMIQVTDLHDQGLTGEGVTVAIFDTGFWLEHEALQGVNVIAEHDFINDDDNTANEPGDSVHQHFHGTWCLSLAAGYSPGNLIGPAYDAEYILAKTEDLTMEEPVEEDWWIEAMEWADSLGAQIITSSLCYRDWYTYEDMDGDTAPITNAADQAVLNGIIVTNAAGNSGASEWRYILAPADGDSVISVGAVDSTQTRVGWSSQGPTYDGRIKPTIMAMGDDVYIVDPNGTGIYRRGQGTSFATPLVAGALALILQQNPAWLPGDVDGAITATGTQSAAPDTLCGWGILQALDASNYLLSAARGQPRTRLKIAVYPNPCRTRLRALCEGLRPGDRLGFYDVRGRVIGEHVAAASDTGPIELDWLTARVGPGVIYMRGPSGATAKVLVLD